MAWWRKSKRDENPVVDWSVKHRIAPTYHGKWVLQEWRMNISASMHIYHSWETLAEYDSPEAATTDYRHVFGNAPVELKASDIGPA